MKIAIDARFYGLEHSGLGRYTINLLRELQKMDKKNKYYILLRKKYYNSLKLTNRWEKVLFDVPHYSIREQILLPRKLSNINPDVFHSLSVNYPFFYNGKSVITIHDLTQLSFTTKASTLPFPIYTFKHHALKFIVKNAIYKCKKIIIPSKAVGRDLIDMHDVDKEKLKVIYEGVSIDDKFQDLNLPPEFNFENEYFLYIGNVYPHKNIERLIEAVFEINKRISNKVLLVIGGSRDVFKKKIDKLILNNNYEQYIRTVGFIPDEYMKKLYENSIAFVYPSLVEGFGLQGLEAMSAGTLLLASDIPVFKELYKENAIYFNPFDYLKISESLEEAMKMNKKLRIKKIEKSKEFIQQYSWKYMAQETLKVYNSIEKILQ